MSAKCGMVCCRAAVSAFCRAVSDGGIEAVLVEDVSWPVERAAHICPFGWLAGRIIVSRTVIILAVNVVSTGFSMNTVSVFHFTSVRTVGDMGMEFVGCAASFRETVVPKKKHTAATEAAAIHRTAMYPGDLYASVASEERSVGRRSREFLPVGMTASTFPVLLP